MTASSAVLRGQVLAEQQMVDTGELRAPSTRVLNQSTGQYAVTPGALKYAGKAKVQTTDTVGQVSTAGDRAVTEVRLRLDLPVSAPSPEVDDVWTHLTSVRNPNLVGRTFQVASIPVKSFPTAQRVEIKETQS